MDMAALLLDEGEWAAAQAWLLEAKPLLAARDDAEYVARANLLLARAYLGLRRGLGGRGASRLLVEGLLQALDERGLQAVLLEAALLELLLQHGHGHPAGGLGRHGARGGSRRDLNARANDATID